MTVSLAMLGYTLIAMAVVLVCHIADKIYDSNHAWELSKSRLLTCRHCGHVFLSGRYDNSSRCPVCGERSGAFRLPQSEIRERIRR